MDFEQMLNAAKARLSRLILGREQTDESLDSSVTGKTSLGLIRIPVSHLDQIFDYQYKINADTKCSAVKEFIDHAAVGNLSAGAGPKGGEIILVNEQKIMHLNLYKYYR